MDAELGSVVVDKEGEISKYIIYRKPPELDISFVPEDILEIKDSETKVDLSGK